MENLIEAYINATNKNIELSLEKHKLEIELEKLQIANEEMALNSISIKQLRRYFKTYLEGKDLYIIDEYKDELLNLLKVAE